MSSVTVPGTGGSTVTVPQSTGTNFVVAQQIAAVLNNLAAGNFLSVNSITGGQTAPTVAGGHLGELLVAGNTSGSVSGSQYAYIVNIDSAPVTIGAAGQTILSGTVGGTFFDSGNSTVVAGGGNNQIVLSGKGYFGTSGDGKDTLSGSGSGTLAGGAGANQFIAGSNSTSSNFVMSQGAADTVSAQVGAVTVSSSGTNATIFNSGATLTVFNTGAGTSVVAGSSSTTAVNTGSLLFVGGTGNATVSGSGGGTETLFGGSGALTFFAGAGSGTLVGGSSTPTVVGGPGGSVVYVGTSKGMVYLAGAGAETANAALSSQGNLMVGGSDSTGSNYLQGGNGVDSLYAGSGVNTLVGGGGSDEFDFFKAAMTGQQNFVMDFSSSDSVFLVGYGSAAASTAIANAQSLGGSTTLTLSDNTKITFVGVGAASSLSGHILSS